MREEEEEELGGENRKEGVRKGKTRYGDEDRKGGKEGIEIRRVRKSFGGEGRKWRVAE